MNVFFYHIRNVFLPHRTHRCFHIEHIGGFPLLYYVPYVVEKNHPRFFQSIFAPAYSTKIAVTQRTCVCMNTRTLSRLPSCPPRNTAIKSGKTKAGSSWKRPLQNCPARPKTELTKMKKLAVAAMLFGASQRSKCSRGERKMPPPMPTTPER